MSSRLVFVLALAGGLAACGPSHTGDDDDDVIDAPVAIDATDAPPGIDAIDAPEPDPSRVYAHSGPMLYRIDTLTMAAVPVGAFTNLGTQGMLDIALDRDERMIGVTATKIFQIDPATAACTFLADYTSSRLTSLSFVPVNIAQPDGAEMLVAATDNGDVVRIDITGTTATATVIGNYGLSGATQIVSSGDLVYIKGVGTFATVDVGPATGLDYLARIDPANSWRATLVGTGTTFNNIFGVAYWGGTLYGFVDDGPVAATGNFIKLDQQTGAGAALMPGSIRWFGAGVTTEAPIIP
jgi:hypothetical protein